MNKDYRKAAMSGALLTSLLLLPLGAQAAKKAPKPAADAKPTEQTSSDTSSYEQWLKKYGAYDRIAQPVADIADTSNATGLKRAEAHLLQGAPKEALTVLEGLKPYDDPQQEIRRLWLGGTAHRALGDPYKAVMWYSQAAKLMDAKQLKAKLSAESGLDALWVDVWRRQFWAFVGNPSASREALALTLHTLLTQAEGAWGQENFWGKATEALDLATGEKEAASSDAKNAKSSKDAGLKIGDDDRLLIAQAVAAASREDYEQARTLLGKVSAAAPRDFWTALVNFLHTGKTPDTKSLGSAGYAKAAGFWNANLLAAYAENRGPWLLGSDVASWARFRDNLAKLSNSEAQLAVDKELHSQLLSDEMSHLLRSLKFSLTLEQGDVDAAKTLWEGLDKRRLPIGLRVAGGIAFKQDLKSLLPMEIGAAGKLSPAMAALLAAGGTGVPLAGEAPFWTRVDVGRSSSVNKVWPLDRLLVLSDWQARWVVGPGPELARRSAFLFPDTLYGYDCLTYLAQKAVENRAFQQAEAYLVRMEGLSTDKNRTAARLGLKAKMERESGKDAEALATYQQIAGLGVDLDPKVRLDMATFFQLKNDLDNGRKQLLILWEQREKLSRNMQAEILFWLGEGEHSLRNYDAALDYYLRLAYQYPKEPMWPTVALYRSAMIYEIKGNYETAKKLLKTVIATADTKEAQEAAKNRLSALEAKSGKPTVKENGQPVYPF
ncbi:MAG: hypothetical protein AUJ49_02405 [Desulfovibrionaceae bacterium CG1_02_65_16]|nr:MAG: hypothetical protein AUJ49_02405 [Desulfovibrionaceae bacterium CG1_02_65_16]